MQCALDEMEHFDRHHLPERIQQPGLEVRYRDEGDQCKEDDDSWEEGKEQLKRDRRSARDQPTLSQSGQEEPEDLVEIEPLETRKNDPFGPAKQGTEPTGIEQLPGDALQHFVLKGFQTQVQAGDTVREGTHRDHVHAGLRITADGIQRDPS